MQRTLGMATLFAFAVSLVACGGGGGGGGGISPPGGGGGGTPPPGVQGNSVGEALPTSAIGVEIDPAWGTVSGFTQSSRSQVIAFAPGTQITVKNLAAAGAAGAQPHTLNFISMSAGPPASFPANPGLRTNASGGSTLAAGFASGPINPGSQMQVTLSTPGTFLVGCAFHYLTNGMRDVIEVSSSATPGPQATPQPSSGGGGGGGCTGVYC